MCHLLASFGYGRIKTHGPDHVFQDLIDVITAVAISSPLSKCGTPESRSSSPRGTKIGSRSRVFSLLFVDEVYHSNGALDLNDSVNVSAISSRSLIRCRLMELRSIVNSGHCGRTLQQL